VLADVARRHAEDSERKDAFVQVSPPGGSERVQLPTCNMNWLPNKDQSSCYCISIRTKCVLLISVMMSCGSERRAGALEKRGLLGAGWNWGGAK
jgi:hypothetical protein